MINVSEALDGDTATLISVQRSVAGSYVDGIWQPGSTFIFQCLASPQQPTPEQLMNLPSGERTQDIMLFICNKLVRTADDKSSLPSDVIIYNGNNWKVIKSADWIAFGHSIAYAVRK